METRTLTVGAEHEPPARLDVFLHAALPGLSRRVVRRLIASGAVRVNGRAAGKGARLVTGDRVTLPGVSLRLDPEPELAVTVVYEDDALVVLDKPGGMPSHALDPWQRGTAAAFLLARWPETADVGERLAPGLVHRLDTGTSGLLVAARTPAAYSALRAALRARRVEKDYVALVAEGTTPLEATLVATPLAHDTRDRRRMVAATPAAAHTWPAATRIEPLARGPGLLVVHASMRTGVTHQIRVHSMLIGHPVLGDGLYGGPVAELPDGRYALHATRLTLPHPDDGRPLRVVSPLPPDLQRLLPERLRDLEI